MERLSLGLEYSSDENEFSNMDKMLNDNFHVLTGALLIDQENASHQMNEMVEEPYAHHVKVSPYTS
ncbi:hypothetical protein EYF80_066511 [Liparis tanakae]|uniref:Uncharacterized protein n=1 Tax=Liparis tanakae TaxID=230148 RepID=A0A4Z2E476_9TELE|nr:hypothetical protein EYF80_066511 [Liparis tanakae]